MYGRQEDRYAQRRLGDALREIEAVREDLIPSLVKDLRDDDKKGTARTVTALIDARTYLAHAMTSIEQARKDLPAVTLEGEPQAITNGRVLGDGTLVASQQSAAAAELPTDAASPSEHPSAAEVMEREG